MSVTSLPNTVALVFAHEGHDHAATTTPTPDVSAIADAESMSGMSSTSPMPGMTASSGMSDMSGMDSMSMGVDILPVWISVIWIVALAAVLIFHCGHLVRMGGEHHWFHSAHIIMLVGMIYMYAMMAFNLTWISSTVWLWLFCPHHRSDDHLDDHTDRRQEALQLPVDSCADSTSRDDLHVGADEQLRPRSRGHLSSTSPWRPSLGSSVFVTTASPAAVMQSAPGDRSQVVSRPRIGTRQHQHGGHGRLHGVHVRRNATHGLGASQLATCPDVRRVASCSAPTQSWRLTMYQQLSYSVTGLSCSGCVNSLTKQLHELEAISDVEIDLVSGAASRVTITLTTSVEDSVVQGAITEAGYAVVGCAAVDSR